MGSCCYDPTEPPKLDNRALLREQIHYDELVKALFTENPEQVLLRELNQSSTYLRELAALNAHYPAVRLRAISLLDSKSLGTLERLVKKEGDSAFGLAAQQKIAALTE